MENEVVDNLAELFGVYLQKLDILVPDSVRELHLKDAELPAAFCRQGCCQQTLLLFFNHLLLILKIGGRKFSVDCHNENHLHDQSSLLIKNESDLIFHNHLVPLITHDHLDRLLMINPEKQSFVDKTMKNVKTESVVFENTLNNLFLNHHIPLYPLKASFFLQ